MKRKIQKLIKNIVFLAIIFILPICVKVLHLNELELILVVVLVKSIIKIYSDFKLGIILRKNFGYYH